MKQNQYERQFKTHYNYLQGSTPQQEEQKSLYELSQNSLNEAQNFSPAHKLTNHKRSPSILDQDESQEDLNIIMTQKEDRANKYQVLLSLKDLENLQKKVESDLNEFKLKGDNPSIAFNISQNLQNSLEQSIRSNKPKKQSFEKTKYETSQSKNRKISNQYQERLISNDMEKNLLIDSLRLEIDSLTRAKYKEIDNLRQQWAVETQEQIQKVADEFNEERYDYQQQINRLRNQILKNKPAKLSDFSLRRQKEENQILKRKLLELQQQLGDQEFVNQRTNKMQLTESKMNNQLRLKLAKKEMELQDMQQE